MDDTALNGSVGNPNGYTSPQTAEPKQQVSNITSPLMSSPLNGQTLTASVQELGKALPVEKVPTGIWGFDEIAHGGIPSGRTTLLSGTSGSGKTIFAAQFLVTGILKYGESGVFVTFEETPADIIKNMEGFNWDLQLYIDRGRLAFVDASPSEEDSIELGDFDLGAFMARLMYAVKKVNAKRMAIDSISALFPRYTDQALIRRELFKISSKLKKMGITTIITGERLGEGDAKAGRFGVEEFVSDNVILLHNAVDETIGDRRRSIEILKFRGTTHETQDTPMLVRENGINVFPRPSLHYEAREFPNVKMPTGIDGLDEMLFGGFYSNSITLTTGPSGVGKTVMCLSFVIEGAKRGEKGLMFAFEESEEELFRNAASFGWDLKTLVRNGLIKLYCSVPERLKAEEHFKHIQDITELYNVKRFVLDSLSSLKRIYTPIKFREFSIGLNAYLKNKGVTSLITETTSSLLEVGEATETHYSSVADSVILMKYVEIEGKLKRMLVVVKARGMDHDKRLREAVIDNTGFHIGEPFAGIDNLMMGKGSTRHQALDSFVKE